MRHCLNIMSSRTDRKSPVVSRMIHLPNSRPAMIRPTDLDSRNMERVDFTTVCAINNPEPVSILSFRFHLSGGTVAAARRPLSISPVPSTRNSWMGTWDVGCRNVPFAVTAKCTLEICTSSPTGSRVSA
jgi:hypothetical protein